MLFMAEYATEAIQNLLKSLSRSVKAVIATKGVGRKLQMNAHSFGIEDQDQMCESP